MGTVFQKTYTRPVPATAEVVAIKGKKARRIARWKSGAKRLEAEVTTTDDGRDVVRVKSTTYYAKYRNADDEVVTVPTGCRDREMAKQCDFEAGEGGGPHPGRRGDPGRDAPARRMGEPIDQHIDAYLATLAGSAMHRQNTGSYLRLLANECGWSCLADLKRSDLETWLAVESRPMHGKPKRSARSRNAYQTALVSFSNWCVDSAKAMPENPFTGMGKASEEADPRRQRRAFTVEEVIRLVEAARNAPERPAPVRKPRPGSKPLRPDVKLSGPDRALLYLVLVQTGLRVGELAEILVRDVRLDDQFLRIDLPARVGKNRREAVIPLRRDLVNALRPRLEGKPPTARVFDVPSSLIARFNADCKRAGIPKRDDRDKTVDIHSLRKTFNTWLAMAGVAPRIAQELMRHQDIKLTMGAYMDPALFDLSAAVEALPPMHQSTPAMHRPMHQTDGSGVHPMSTDVNEGGDKDGQEPVP